MRRLATLAAGALPSAAAPLAAEVDGLVLPKALTCGDNEAWQKILRLTRERPWPEIDGDIQVALREVLDLAGAEPGFLAWSFKGKELSHMQSTSAESVSEGRT